MTEADRTRTQKCVETMSPSASPGVCLSGDLLPFFFKAPMETSEIGILFP